MLYKHRAFHNIHIINLLKNKYVDANTLQNA